MWKKCNTNNGRRRKCRRNGMRIMGKERKVEEIVIRILEAERKVQEMACEQLDKNGQWKKLDSYNGRRRKSARNGIQIMRKPTQVEESGMQIMGKARKVQEMGYE